MEIHRRNAHSTVLEQTFVIAEDYYKDTLFVLEREGAYKGYIDIELTEGYIIQKLYLGDNEEITEEFLNICQKQI